jgi:sugar porter (SP) family MFS transporter
MPISPLNSRARYISLIAIIAGFAGLLLGYDAGIIGVSKDQVMPLFFLSDNQWSIIAGASIFGALIGLPISGMLSNRLGRKNMLVLVAIGFMGGIILTATSEGMTQFLLGRFITGISIGMGSFTTPLFISEIAPTQIRGTLLLINGIAITTGQSLSFLVGYFVHHISIQSWRYLVIIGIIPAIFLLVGMFFIPHSPRWVAMNYGIEKARLILNKLRGNSLIVEKELIEIQEIVKQQDSSISFLKLFSQPLKRVTLVGIILGMLQQLMGIGTLLYYGPFIFYKAGFTPISNAIFATFGIGIVNLISTISLLFLVDRFGRRPLLLAGTLIAGISLILVGIVNQAGLLNPWLTFICIATFVIGYCVSLGSLFWIIIAEIYPLKARGLAMSFAAMAETWASLIVTLTFLPLVQSSGLSHAYWIYAGMCFLSFIFIYFYVPETKAVSLEQIESNVIAGVRTRHLGNVNVMK